MTPDKKTELTKHLMTDSLKKIMAQKPLNKISIREICEGCGVNRQTFYYHFDDIYDQVKWMYEQEAISLLKENEGVLIWQDGLLQLFHYIEENRAVSMCALKSLGREHLKKFFHKDVHDIIQKAVSTADNALPTSKKHEDFLIEFYTAAIVGLLENWFLGDLKETPEEIIENLDTVIKNQMIGAIQKTNCKNPM
ncbi:MAG: TetR/AcrR family transcriptional regulator [Candidatus Metalachnospira sp.]|nr:TetR/AcrR family transcriptional regulator [Candidatus Metalachnospira sp.]